MTTDITTERRIVNLLRECGVPASIDGYTYAKEAITLCLNDSNYLRGITKRLYPDIAKKFGTTASRVERAIRHAVEVAMTNGNFDKIERIFGYTFSATKGGPTNSCFIATIAEEVKLTMAEDAAV